MELFSSLNPVADTHSPYYKLQHSFGQGRALGSVLGRSAWAGSWWTRSAKSCSQARTDVPEMTRENSQAGEQSCPIDAFMEPIFTLLTTRYLPKEENVVLDGQSVPALYWTYLHPHGTTLLFP